MYRGRFAPSPTGPLHFGSLVAALASFLDARANQGVWLVRMEDLDRPREAAGAADDILRTLEAYGLEWNETVMYQSRRGEAYQAALETLVSDRLAYPCSCTRSEISQIAQPGVEGPIYPGTCRDGLAAGKTTRAWRVRVTDSVIDVHDLIQGTHQQNLASEIGDFVIRRADELFAYQLAVVVDDAEQQISHILRGTDLLLSSARQIYLQQLLKQTTPVYAHIPVAVNRHNEKLSKQTYAPAVSRVHPVPVLLDALAFLNQPIPEQAGGAEPAEVLKYAIGQWRLDAIPKQLKIPAPLRPTSSLE